MKINEKLTQDIRNQIGNLSNLETTDKSSLVNAVNEIKKKELKKLWENKNPKNAISSQTITLSSDDYDYLIFFYYDDIGENYSMSRQSIKGSGTVLNHSFSGSLTNISRAVDYKNDIELIIQECRTITQTGASVTNDRLIPFVIYGGKF